MGLAPMLVERNEHGRTSGLGSWWFAKQTWLPSRGQDVFDPVQPKIHVLCIVPRRRSTRHGIWWSWDALWPTASRARSTGSAAAVLVLRWVAHTATLVFGPAISPAHPR
jgi:hypothetical protein